MTDEMDDLDMDERDLAATEARLRRALDGHASGVDVGSDAASLAAIQARLRDSAAVQQRWRAVVALVGVAAVVALVLGVTGLLDDGNRQQLRTTPPATEEREPAPTTTTEVTATSTPAPATTADGIWPPEGHAPYDDPVDAARSLALEYLGVENPKLSGFRAVDDSSGEVDLSLRRENGSFAVVTTVRVRKAGSHWAVTSAQSADVVVDNPRPLDTVGSPLVVDGRGRGYEGNIVVIVREAGMGADRSLGQEAGIAGCCEELLPFHIELDLAERTKPTGSLLAMSENQYTIVPVQFGPTPTTGPQVSDETTVDVHWVTTAGQIVPKPRTVRRSEGVLRGAVQQLLYGPYSVERDAGLGSGLANGAAAVTFDVKIENGLAIIDFAADLIPASPGTSSSAASEGFLRQLHATVFQFPTVQRAEYRLAGSCEAFWAWLQRGCTTVDRRSIGI